MPHLLKSSCRLELLIARLADRKLNLSFRSIARSFDRGSVLGNKRVSIKKAAFGGANNSRHNHGRKYRLSGLGEEEGVDR